MRHKRWRRGFFKNMPYPSNTSRFAFASSKGKKSMYWGYFFYVRVIRRILL